VTAETAELVGCSDDAIWDDVVADSPQGSAFVRSWYLRALNVDGDLRVDRWLLRGGRGVQAAAVVLCKGGEPVDAPYPFSPYQSLLLTSEVANAPAHRAGREIAEVLGRLAVGLSARYRRLSFCLHPSVRDVRGLQWFHYGQADAFRFDVRYTGLIDLSAFADFDAYLGTIRPTRRNEYRRALGRGLCAESSRDVDLLDHLHAKTFARQGIARPAHEAALLRAISTAALDADAGELLFCRAPSGEVVSAVLFIHDDRTGIYLFGANAPEHRNLDGGALLLLEAVRRGQGRGLTGVDLCGVNSPQRGDFKTSLGGVVTPYFLARWEALVP
jgi:Acetyltransferase (GNAT) domain